MKNRKAYWIEYQRRRRQKAATQTAELLKSSDQDQLVFSTNEDFLAAFKAECKARGLAGQKNWRKRARLKSEMHKDWYKQAPHQLSALFQHTLWSRSRTRARAAKIPFNLAPKHIPLPTTCPILNILLDYTAVGVRLAADSPSIDRIDNTRGYEPGNVQVISHRANKLKNDATLDELIALGNWAATKKT